jgi:hypothetical protein
MLASIQNFGEMNKAIILLLLFDLSFAHALIGQNSYQEYPRISIHKIDDDFGEISRFDFELPEFRPTILDCFSSVDQLKKNRNFYFTYSSCFGKRGWELLARVSVTRKNFFGFSFSRRIVKKVM